MKYYGTKNNKDYGFYEEPFDNAIEITDDYWTDLLDKQNEGKRIIPFENSVIAIDENEYSFENGQWIKLSESDAKIKQLTIANEIRANEIREELEKLDIKRIRAIAEPALADDETTWLEYYNNQIQQLREELAQLTS